MLLANNTKYDKKGFTLIELLVVMAIITLLAIVTTASLTAAKAKSRDARRIADISKIQLALAAYYDDQNAYPDFITAGMPITNYPSSTIIYLLVTPSNPSPSDDGSCTASITSYSYAANGVSSYSLGYCLGTRFNGYIPAGNNTATPRTLY